MSVRFNFNPRRYVFGVQWLGKQTYAPTWRHLSVFVGPVYWHFEWRRMSDLSTLAARAATTEGGANG